MRSFQFTAHCRHCFSSRSLTRDQVATGRSPTCDGCGDTMVVYSGTGALPEALNHPADRPLRSLDELRGKGLI